MRMGLTKTLFASAALIAVGATATVAAEVPQQRAAGFKIGQLSTPSVNLPTHIRGPKAQKGVKVAQRWRRRRRRRRNRAIAGAIALGIAAAIAAEAARADDRRYYGRKCRRWARLCDRGRDWACDRYDYNC